MNRVAQIVIEIGEYTGTVRGYERYGLFFAEAVGYRISPDGSTIPLFYVEVKIDTTSLLALDPVKSNWEFVEVWIDAMLSPPYVLLLLSAKKNLSALIHKSLSSQVNQQR